ncbi:MULTISPECIES: HlyD family efflux transporter periplasmic adaptor subunit [Agrobacterium]|uniref:HlyD family efflux transporter periplasmic adaptor subunit n=1 Tax=Agrobacterium TaxID=357 RepID=UPI003BA1D837
MFEGQSTKDQQLALFREQAVAASTTRALILDHHPNRTSKASLVSLFSICILVAGGFVLNSGVSAVETPGTVESLPRTALLKAPEDGLLDRIYVNDGQHVNEGQPVADIIIDSFDPERRGGIADRRLAEIQELKAKLEFDASNSRRQFEHEERQAKALGAAYRAQMISLDAQIDALDKAAEARNKELEVVSGLGRKQIISGRERDQVASQYYTSLGDKLELNVQRDALVRELEKLSQDIDLKRISLEANQQSITSQFRMLAIEADKLSNSNKIQLVAPTSGVIQLFKQNDRSVINTAEVVAAIRPQSPLNYASFNLEPTIRSQISGSNKEFTMSIVTDSTVRRIKGTIEQVSNAPVTADNKYAVRIKLGGDDQQIIEGSPLTLHLYHIRSESLLGKVIATFQDIAMWRQG